MASLTIHLPSQAAQRGSTSVDGLSSSPIRASRIEGRVETDRYGRAVLTPVAAVRHGMLQVAALRALRRRYDNVAVGDRQRCRAAASGKPDPHCARPHRKERAIAE